MKTLKRQLGMSLLLRLILKPEDSPEELRKIGAIAVNLTQLGYSREEEFEADRYGVYFMEKAGYQRQGIINFWEWILEASGGEKTRIFFIFFRHILRRRSGSKEFGLCRKGSATFICVWMSRSSFKEKLGV